VTNALSPPSITIVLLGMHLTTTSQLPSYWLVANTAF
jgi:hypothetical protein